MIYSERYVTRWHDTDAMRLVKPTAMLVYMQETSNKHMQKCGPSLDELRDRERLAFILSKTRMKLYRPLYAFEDIEVQTWTCPAHGLSIPRFYRILRNGELIAEADTTWALLNIDTKTLVRAEECTAYGFEDEPMPQLTLPTRFKLPKGAELKSCGIRRIVYSDLDYNMHMNNTKYTDMLCDFIDPQGIPKIGGIILSYLNEAAFNDELDVLCAYEDESYYFRTVSKTTGKVCLEAQLILDR